jgi:N-acyl homoserine lactone hydrolase
MIIRPYTLNKNRIVDWDEIFPKPRPITLRSFKTGKVIINRKGTLNPQHPQARDIKNEKLEVPIMAHWIHHEEKGDYFLDAGLDDSYYMDPFGGLKGSEVDEFNQDENENIANHLDRNRILLKGVFLSHLHADHAAGQRELPRDIKYVAAKGEYENYHPKIYGDFLKGLGTLHEIDFNENEEIKPLGPSADLLGDGSLWAILTPGHTPGHTSFLVNGFDGPIFLTMDACFIQENLEAGVAPIDYTWNVEMAQETLEKIIAFLAEYPQVRVICGHECPIA